MHINVIKTTFSVNWEISFKELEDAKGKKYKVTRRLSDYSIAETKIFKSKKKALKQLTEWSNQSFNF